MKRFGCNRMLTHLLPETLSCRLPDAQWRTAARHMRLCALRWASSRHANLEHAVSGFTRCSLMCPSDPRRLRSEGVEVALQRVNARPLRRRQASLRQEPRQAQAPAPFLQNVEPAVTEERFEVANFRFDQYGRTRPLEQPFISFMARHFSSPSYSNRSSFVA